MKYGLIINQALWFIHDIYIKAYPAVMLEIILVISTSYSIIKLSKINNIYNKFVNKTKGK